MEQTDKGATALIADATSAVAAIDAAPVRVPPQRNRGGVWVRLGGEQYLIPPLSLNQPRVLEPRIQQMQAAANASGSMPSLQSMDHATHILHAALSRNYDGISVETLGDLIDIGNVFAVLNAIMAASGLERGKVGPSTGEAPASTGT